MTNTVLASPPLQSANDKRAYRYLILENGLHVLLCQDDATEKASCCVDVRVGSLQDPPEAPGLAHFLEHLLFMGTERYPVENHYSQFLNEHGGSSNAYTSMENTVYFFDVLSDSLEEALNIFSAFFVCPLFAEGSTEREINAVDSENSKNLQSDGWRFFQLFKSMCRVDHPFNAFATGNAATLGEAKKARELCMAFHKKWYSAGLMRCVLYGKEPLDVLQKWAEEKFSAVSNNNVAPPMTSPILFAPDGLARLVSVVPVRELKALTLYWPCPSPLALYESKPTSYLSHLLGHEGGGSILSALKGRGLANSLSAYVTHETGSFAVLSVNVELTDLGVAQYQSVLRCIFSYIGLLRSEGTKDWIYSELQSTYQMEFRFLNATDPIDYAVSVANNMQTMQPQHCLAGPRLIFHFDEAQAHGAPRVGDFLGLLSPENCVVFLKYNGLAGKTDCKEKWYGTEYSARSFSAEELEQLKALSAGTSAGAGAGEWGSMLHLPVPNEFIPTDFELKPRPDDADPSKAPALLSRLALSSAETFEGARATAAAAAAAAVAAAVAAAAAAVEDIKLQDGEGEEGEGEEGGGASTATSLPLLASTTTALYHLQDNTWNVPKLNVSVLLESAHAFSTPLAVAQTEVLASVLKELLSEYSYYADCACLYFSVSATKGGLLFHFYGFSHKLPVLVRRVMAELKKMCSAPEPGSGESIVGEALFSRIKEKKLRQFANFKFWPPYNHAHMGVCYSTEFPRWSDAEKHAALKPVGLGEFEGFCRLLLTAARTVVLVHGNADSAEAVALGAVVTDTLAFSPLPETLSLFRRCVQLQPHTVYVHRSCALLTNPEEPNSCCRSCFLWPPLSDILSQSEGPEEVVGLYIRNAAMVTLLVQILSEAAFDQLRTKEQLGYIVWTTEGRTANHQHMISITVQSSHKGPEYLDGRIDSFLQQHYLDVVSALTPEALLVHVQACVEKTLERPKNLDEETERHWEELAEGRGLFHRRALLVEALKASTLEQLQAAYRDFLLGSERRVKTKFLGFFYGKGVDIPTETAEQWAPDVRTVIVGETGAFKRSRPLQPVVDLIALVEAVAK